jgi:hypothetical protein
VLERDGFQPGDSDVDVGAAFLASRKIELLALGRARAHEHGIETTLVQQVLHRPDGVIELEVHAHVDDLRDLVVEHLGRQPERGDVGAHEPARHGELLEDRDRVTQRHEVVGDRE